MSGSGQQVLPFPDVVNGDHVNLIVDDYHLRGGDVTG